MKKQIGLMVLGMVLGLAVHAMAGGYGKGSSGTFGGVLYADDGTAAAPSHTYLSDATTGMYLYGDGTNGFSVLTVPVWYYDTNGITLLSHLVYTGNGSGLTNIPYTGLSFTDWTGTFDGQEGIWYSDIGNQTGTMANAVMDTIARVGTVTSGTWNATAIGDAYLTKTGDWTGTLDGYEAAAFGQLAAANTWTATNTFPIQTGTYATTNTLTATQMRGAIIYVTGAATLTLPAVSPGDHVTVITIGAVAVSVDPNGNDKIYLDGVALDDGDKITNNSAAGNIAVITYYSADGWHASTDGWTDGN